jgi:hypothetical protein
MQLIIVDKSLIRLNGLRRLFEMRIRKLRWCRLFRFSGMLAASSVLGLGQPLSVHAGNFADMWSSGNAYTGYPNTSYSPILPAGIPQAQVGLLPTGAYASQYYRAPTTYYRPVTSFDPRLGTTVTTLQPCTSYQYQAQRVPLLVPETHSTAAYGSYGVSPQNRFSPGMVANTNASASGQSTMSIPSGLGSQYTAPVVQMPSSGVAMYSQAPVQLPQTQFMPQNPFPTGSHAINQQVSPVYGGVQYGQPMVQSNPSYNTTVTSPVATAVVPAAAWTTTTVNGGYIGNGSQQFSQPAISTQPTMAQPTMPQPPTTMGPPVITSVPANQNNVTYGSNTAPAFGPMPGSMGSPVMPGSVYPPETYPSSTYPSSTYPSSTYPSATAPANSVYPSAPSLAAPSLRDSESSIAPQLPPSSLKPIMPAENTYPRTQLPTEIMPSNILPETTEESTRFQLRRVERDMIGPSNPQGTPLDNSSPINPFGPQTLNKPAVEPNTGAAGSNPDLMKSPSLDQPAGNGAAPALEMKLESLKPIPAPPSFDGSPEWRPVLLTPRDQTAGLPDRSPTSNLAASHQFTSTNSVPSVADVRPSRAPAPAIANSLSIEEELQSNLIYFNRSQHARNP